MSELEINKINDNIAKMSTRLDEVYSILIGSEHDKDSGYLSRVKDLEAMVEDLIDFKKKVVYIAIGMSVPTGMGVWQIIGFLTGTHQ